MEQMNLQYLSVVLEVALASIGSVRVPLTCKTIGSLLRSGFGVNIATGFLSIAFGPPHEIRVLAWTNEDSFSGR